MAIRLRNDIQLLEFRPRAQAKFERGLLTTNQWGMRDKEYQLKKPPRTYRFAILGASPDLGMGISNSNVYESLVEERLNESNLKGEYTNFEILNFSAPGATVLRHGSFCEKKLFQFEPNAVFYIAHANEAHFTVNVFSGLLKTGANLEYDFLKDLKKQSEAYPLSTEQELIRRLLPFGYDMIHLGLRKIGEQCRQHEAIAAMVFIPSISESASTSELAALAVLGKQEGFLFLDLSDAYGRYDDEELRVGRVDYHPNELGHRLIARLLYQRILENQHALGLR